MPSLFQYQAFFLTAPYFFGISLLLVCLVLAKEKIILFKDFSLVLSLLILVILNFTSVRYSLPVFFSFFIFILFAVLNLLEDKSVSSKLTTFVFFLYILLSIPFIFLDVGWEETGRFVGFVGSPTVYAGIITALLVIVSKDWSNKSLKFIFFLLIVFWLVYLSKTRLILIFILIFPVLRYLVDKKSWFSLRKVFFIFLITIMSIYPLYGQVVKWFPTLVSIRYEDNRDASFGLRYFAYKKVTNQYVEGTFGEKLLGKGNEASRNYIMDLFKFDLMPHNDFVRILYDWGALGLILFLVLLYRLSTKNKEACFVSIVYMLLFYSNMVFNIYLISLLVIMYHKKDRHNQSSNQIIT